MAGKLCTKCGVHKPLGDFHARFDGARQTHRSHCKKCMYEASRLYPGLRTLQDNWRNRNRAMVNLQQQVRRKTDPAKNAAHFNRWRKNNLAHCAEKSRRRDASKIGATPVWANRIAIAAIYARAAELTRLTGIKHEVDHIFPLQSDIMCGLHVETNLQILTKAENSAKRNRVPACL